MPARSGRFGTPQAPVSDLSVYGAPAAPAQYEQGTTLTEEERLAKEANAVLVRDVQNQAASDAATAANWAAIDAKQARLSAPLPAPAPLSKPVYGTYSTVGGRLSYTPPPPPPTPTVAPSAGALPVPVIPSVTVPELPWANFLSRTQGGW
jgi:hypothetical protein